MLPCLEPLCFCCLLIWFFWKKLQIIGRHVPNQGKCPSIHFFFFQRVCVHICRLSRCEWRSGRPGDLFRGDYICHWSPPTHTYTPVSWLVSRVDWFLPLVVVFNDICVMFHKTSFHSFLKEGAQWNGCFLLYLLNNHIFYTIHKSHLIFFKEKHYAKKKKKTHSIFLFIWNFPMWASNIIESQ